MFKDKSLNPNWRGGIAEYQNHSKMKKTRKQVLMEENYTCYKCGGYTEQIHHLDKTKYNHDRRNLRACCQSCNLKMAKPRTSKFKRLYGKTLSELGEYHGKSSTTILRWHRGKKLIPDEISAVLF